MIQHGNSTMKKKKRAVNNNKNVQIAQEAKQIGTKQLRKYKSEIANIEAKGFCANMRPFLLSEDNWLVELYRHGMQVGAEIGVKSEAFIRRYVKFYIYVARKS